VSGGGAWDNPGSSPTASFRPSLAVECLVLLSIRRENSKDVILKLK